MNPDQSARVVAVGAQLVGTGVAGSEPILGRGQIPLDRRRAAQIPQHRLAVPGQAEDLQGALEYRPLAQGVLVLGVVVGDLIGAPQLSQIKTRVVVVKIVSDIVSSRIIVSGSLYVQDVEPHRSSFSERL